MRRPIERVMSEINENLKEKGRPQLPQHTLRVVAERHLDDVEFGTFIQWKRRQKEEVSNGRRS